VNRLYFDPFVLDLERRLLLRGEESIHITPKAFQLLHTLADNAPKAMSKDELFDLVWEGIIVAEVNLASTINDLRTALGDDARHPKFIRTVHAFGYAFIAPVRTETGAHRRSTRFHLLVSGNDVPLAGGEHIIGRDQDATVVVPDSAVSRRHARIMVREDSALLEDLGSKNGTFLNGTRLAEPTTLRPGDVITVGSITAVFSDLGKTDSTKTLGHTR
jgi:DNA-binding winged helix-turn-helix (wHTH) protein